MTLTARFGLLTAITSLFSACATTAPAPDILQPISADVSSYASVAVSTTAGASANVMPFELARISEKVVAEINRKHYGWAQAGTTGPLLLELQITRYDRGNAFARFMLAGLGQMHIDGQALVRDPATSRELGRYSVSKTFAWGGIYGGMTKIEEIEAAFAESVAAGIRK
jgi:hypothetical protein